MAFKEGMYSGNINRKKMKKIIYSKFGGAEVLQIAEVPTPAVQETTVLIKVEAVSINPLDWKIRNGEMKLMSGSKFPKGIGIDFLGIVTETGTAVTKYKKVTKYSVYWMSLREKPCRNILQQGKKI